MTIKRKLLLKIVKESLSLKREKESFSSEKEQRKLALNKKMADLLRDASSITGGSAAQESVTNRMAPASHRPGSTCLVLLSELSSATGMRDAAPHMQPVPTYGAARGVCREGCGSRQACF